MKRSPNSVTPIIPANTAAPSDGRILAPAPVSTAQDATEDEGDSERAVTCEAYKNYNFILA